MIRKLAYLICVGFTLLAADAYAYVSTINPNIPYAGQPMSPTPLRENYAAAYNDVNTLSGLIDASTTSALNLGASLSAAKPRIPADPLSGLSTLGAGKIDIGIGGVKITEWTSAGMATTGTVSATTFSGSGASLTTIGTSNMTAVVGAGNSTTFLRGDNTWSTIAGSGGVTGTGFANYVPLWSSATNIGTSIVYQASNKIGIGTTNPQNLLEVGAGVLGAFTGSHLSVSSTIANSGVDIGQGLINRGRMFWSYNATPANAYMALGVSSGTNPLVLQDGGGNVGIGTTTIANKLDINGAASIGFNNTAAPTNGLAVSGHVLVEGVTSTGATGTGNFMFSASPTTTGTLTAGGVNLSNQLSLIYSGPAMLYSNTGATTDNKNWITAAAPTSFRLYAMNDAGSASTSVMDVTRSGTTISSIAFSAGATPGTEGMRITSTGAVGVGTTSPLSKLDVNGTINISGYPAIKLPNADYTSVGVANLSLVNPSAGLKDNTAIGYRSGQLTTTGGFNINVGAFSGSTNATGSNNVYVGYEAGFAGVGGNSSTFIGDRAGEYSVASGTTQNTAVGAMAMVGNSDGVSSTGTANTAVGYNSFASFTSGTRNSGLGYQALADTTTGSSNTAFGYNTGRGITTGSSNTIIGAGVTGLAAGLNNNIIIADGAGNQRINVDASGNVGIGTSTPLTKLHVQAGGGFSGAVNSTNIATFANTASAGTAASIEVTSGSTGQASIFLGGDGATSYNNGRVTYDASLNALSLWAADIQSFTINSSGAVGIGTATPFTALDVNGTARANLFSGSGASLTGIGTTNMSAVTGTANSTTFLRGDNVWGTAASSQWTTSGSNINYTTGNVSIGTTAASSKLNVGSASQFTVSSAGAVAAPSINFGGSTLNTYATGAWTPTDMSGAGLTFTVIYANYTVIGNMVAINAEIVWPTTADVSQARIAGLPFAANGFGTAAMETTAAVSGLVSFRSGGVEAWPLLIVSDGAITNANLSTKLIIFSGVYFK